MMPQKKSGLENLPLKAVIALMGAAAVAAVLSRPAKDPRTASVSLFLSVKALGGGAYHISHCVRCSKSVACCHLSVDFGVMLHIALLCSDSPQLKPSAVSFQVLYTLYTLDFI